MEMLKDHMVDKTDYLYDIITKENRVFCARPCGFGKTMTMDMLDDIFQGKRELFEGLALFQIDYDWKKFPVIHLNFSTCTASTVKAINEWIHKRMVFIADVYQDPLEEEPSCVINFRSLFKKLYKTDDVVLLIDAYDSVLLNNLNNPELPAIKELLLDFFSVIKEFSEHIHFCFITGHTLFPQELSLRLPPFNDITYNQAYATMFGYTQEEMEAFFAKGITDGMRRMHASREAYLKRVQEKHGGYRFHPSAPMVYNPISISAFFEVGKGVSVDDFWSATGNMHPMDPVVRKLTIENIAKFTSPFPKAYVHTAPMLDFLSKGSDDNEMKALLLQIGTLTVTGVGDDGSWRLDFPNTEVRRCFCWHWLIRRTKEKMHLRTDTLLPLFQKGDVKQAMIFLNYMYAPISFWEHEYRYEGDYKDIFLIAMKSIGAKILDEVDSYAGYIDAVLECPKDCYIFTFQTNRSTEIPIERIKAGGYIEMHHFFGGKPVHIVGLEFSTMRKNLFMWNCETMEPPTAC